tara:strand:+ start:245 stop:748 length:504 start_codon:yes stop_codon:yes gene_type:complete
VKIVCAIAIAVGEQFHYAFSAYFERSGGREMKRATILLCCTAMACADAGAADEGAEPVEVEPTIDEQARELVAKSLLDPESARFRNVVRRPFSTGTNSVPDDLGGFIYCGEVNGKNAFGGYAGFKTFAIAFGEAHVGNPDDPASELAYMSFCNDPAEEQYEKEVDWQ